MKKRTVLWGVSILVLLLAAGCAGGATPAAHTVEAYLEAFAAKDEAGLHTYICSDYEFEAFLEFDSFALSETTLEDVACRESGAFEGGVEVTCTGSIRAGYGGEGTQFDLAERVYQVIEENGNWLVCGEETRP